MTRVSPAFRRRLLGGSLLILAVVALGCTPRMMRAGNGDGKYPQAALYKVRIASDLDGTVRKFRMWLFAAADGRMHAEIISAVGTTEVIVDTDSDRMSVQLLRRKVAYSGAVAHDTLRNIWGVDSSISEFVQLFGAGDIPDGWSRVDGEGGYPQELGFDRRGRSVSLSLRKVQRLGVDGDDLGIGVHPVGFERRPLSDLRLEQLPGVEKEGGG